MRNTIGLPAIVVSIICLLALDPVADDRPSGPLAYRSLELSGAMDNGSEYTLTIVLERGDSSITERKSESNDCFGYPIAGIPTAIQDLSLTVANREQFIPENSYSDLCEINLTRGIGIGEDKDSVFIYLMGGLGQRSYNVTFALKRDSLVSRRVEYTDSKGRWKSDLKLYSED